MYPSPKVITGNCHLDNLWATDWGCQGLLAYGCHRYIVIIDTKTLQVIQTLVNPKGNILKVKWRRENFHHDLYTGEVYHLTLAAVDTTGTISVWDVTSGEQQNSFTLGNKQILDIAWYASNDEEQNQLISLHAPDTVALWDVFTGVIIKQKSLSANLTAFTLDLFDFSRIAFQSGSDAVVLVSDFPTCSRVRTTKMADICTTGVTDLYLAGMDVRRAIAKSLMSSALTSDTPATSPGFIRRTSSSSSSSSTTGMKSNTSSVAGMKKTASSTSWSKMVSNVSSKMVSNVSSNIQSVTNRLSGIDLNKRASTSEEETEAPSVCVQVTFNPAHRHHLLVVFSREVVIMDLDVDMVLGVIRLDSVMSSLVMVYPCRWTDTLLCLHENGSITARVLRIKTSVTSPIENVKGNLMLDSCVTMEMMYDLRSQSDSLRLMRQAKVYGFSCNPITEQSAAVVLSDGRVLRWDIMVMDFQDKQTKQVVHLKQTLSDLIGDSVVLPPGDQRVMSKEGISLRFMLTGLVSRVHSPITVLQVAPSGLYNDECLYSSTLAVGSVFGSVQLLDVMSGQVEKELKLFMTPVRGIEWVNPSLFLSYSYPDPTSYGKVKNEVLLVNSHSGHIESIRAQKDNETNISAIHVAPAGQSFVITFMNKPLEVWSLRTKQLIRELEIGIPIPTAMAWYPVAQWCKPSPTSNIRRKVSSEQFFMAAIAMSGKLYRVKLEDSMIEDISSFTMPHMFGPEVRVVDVTSMVWKDKLLLMGDASGQVFMADGTQKISATRKIYERLGFSIRKMTCPRGHGSRKFLVLFEDCLVLLQLASITHKAEVLKTLEVPGDLPPIIDVVWVGPDHVVLALKDGSVHVVDTAFQRQSSSLMGERKFYEAVFSPYILVPKTSFHLKYTLMCGYVPAHAEAFQRDETYQQQKKIVQAQMKLVDRELLDSLKDPHLGTAERCFQVARLFGDECDIDFWRLVLYYVDKSRNHGRNYLNVQSTGDLQLSNKSTELFSCTAKKTTEVSDLIEIRQDENSSVWGDDLDPLQHLADSNKSQSMTAPLESCFDALVDTEHYQQYQMSRLALHNRKRSTHEEKQDCVSRYIMANRLDMAVQLLLETDIENDGYLADCLKACLVSSARSSSTSLSTIKLAATHLIAAGKLLEGIQLLCLIEKRLDACKYFHTYSQWDQGVWLAKLSLPYLECVESLLKVAEHLWDTKQKCKAVLLMLSMGQFHRVVYMLRDMKQYDKAALFLQTCLEQNLIAKNEDSEPIRDDIFLTFAKVLQFVGYRDGAKHYCQMAGADNRKTSY